MLLVIINTKRHSLVQFIFKSVCFFKKMNFAILKLIYFQF